jgi:hypothetical protein
LHAWPIGNQIFWRPRLSISRFYPESFGRDTTSSGRKRNCRPQLVRAFQSLSFRRFIVKTAIIMMPLILLALSGCGRDPGERALTGGGIGAGVGLVGGAMVGAPVEGALIGGAVGAGTGALTSPRQIDLNH